MQHILNVIEPALVDDLLTLDELKIALGIATTDTTKDEMFTQLIDQASDVLATLANRVFAYEKVEENFYEIADHQDRRLFFSRWPVKFADIEMLLLNGVDILDDPFWILEEENGTAYNIQGPWQGTVNSVYSGGYKCPDEVPPALKQLAVVLAREGYYTTTRGATLAGVRMIAHKQARVMYYDQNNPSGGTSGTALSPAAVQAVNSVLNHFIRHWV